MSPGALDGLLVVDLSRFVSAPYATMLMADAGATVVKIEPPGGEPGRTSPPLVRLGEAEVGATFLRMNRNKRSVELDLKSEDGRRALRGLLAKADVLVENFRAGVLGRLGFDDEILEELNPRLIYASISGFGHSDSPYRDRPAFNLIAEYEAGVYQHGGAVPMPLGPYVGDLFPGMHMLAGVLMALYQRTVTGRGSRVDIAMFDAMLSFNEAAASNGTWMEGDDPGAPENFYCPSGVYPSGDGFVCLDVVTDAQWQALCQMMAKPELISDPRLATGPLRVQNYEAALSDPLLRWLAARPSEETAELLSAQGVPAAVVRRPEAALLGQQAEARSMAVHVGIDSAAALCVPASPIRVDGRTSQPFAQVPRSGEGTEEFLSGIGAVCGQDG